MTRSLTDDFQYKSEILTSKFNDWFEPAEFWRLSYIKCLNSQIHNVFRYKYIFIINYFWVISSF